ncbi:DUF4810 domain-containing protein [Pseudoalteromonas sp. McH1-7]|uniref:Type IV secretion system putative lipoprotein virB7 n=1 Tax=Pseudoalteromonas peptidolytica F12-50-A1 TaxID=1315280 RepID=A0A8I0MYB2_9GAMM|nr:MULTISPECIES: DUF4810 domain-containing protein [Pseudoalteromonas]MBE0348081.1 hypothetical protein [Pseudoalteromonas peptidolytica F12-50-A1]MDW7550829.1 DUF4810 domain-containing protein [Pseudoalteromonas peptidolytica]NLR15682.1 DUF4810 domain-containing protein [Pseudoalteromonas peptidolytica]NUZ11394.1 DUF4810 domain-containing protein [Pseudoalteromonas sp. McH1-7]USD28700.1 DUF4810 domain-containing protein [Pseudoalteromonas sp. SCSIO 43201]
MKKTIFLVVLLLVLSGCQSTTPQYYYGSYERNVYAFFRGDMAALNEQIAELESDIARAEANQLSPAPGMYAHLGYLHLLQGDQTKGFSYFEQEKQLFPESQHYINFLMVNAQGE